METWQSYLLKSTLFLLFLFLSHIQPSLIAQNTSFTLKKDQQPITQNINKGETHTYTLKLSKDQFFAAIVYQDGIDLSIAVFDESGEKINEFDSPNGTVGPEPITIISKEAGTYKLAVTPLDDLQEKGNYTFEIIKWEGKPKTKEEMVDRLFTFWDKVGSPGAAVAVVQNNKLLYSKGYGSANLEYDIPNSPKTIFHIASVSKQFTAFSMVLLADQGKISLDDDISKYFPEMHDFGEKITIRHLIHHTSGLRDQWNLLAMAGWRLDDVITTAHVMKLMENQKELNFKPGAEYLYCNSGYTLMGQIVKRVTDQPFPEWAEENIFKPLGMTNTLFYDDHERIVKNRAYSYYSSGNGFKKSVLSYANAGATSLFTTVEDLAKWAVNYEQIEVGNKQVMEQMHERGILNNGDTLNYAFGQSISKYKGLTMMSHGGADAGYRTYLARFPEQDFAVVVFSNLGSFNPGGQALNIAEIYLEDFIEQPEEKPDATPPVASESNYIEVDKAILESYEGKYEIQPGFILNIFLEGDKIFAQATGQPKIELKAKSATELFAETANATLVFQKNEDKKIDKLILLQSGQEITAPRIADFEPDKVNLEAFLGEYFSSELNTTYTLQLKDDKLVARHQRHPDIALKPSKKDEFNGNTWFFRGIRMIRDDAGNIKGMKVTNGRVRDLWFEKVRK